MPLSTLLSIHVSSLLLASPFSSGQKIDETDLQSRNVPSFTDECASSPTPLCPALTVNASFSAFKVKSLDTWADVRIVETTL